MFTGIIEELGEVVDWAPSADAARITVRAPLSVSDAAHGDSISVGGVCLTVIDLSADTFTADVMAESIAMSTLSGVTHGTRVNLERAAQVGDRLGGHIVQGHIDGTARLISVTPGSAWRVLRFSLAADIAPLVARKGSIALDGVSLTVSAVGRDWFEVSLIPETLTATTLGLLAPGDAVNVETDILARHLLRAAEFENADLINPPSDAAERTGKAGSGGVVDLGRGSAGIHGRTGVDDAPANPETETKTEARP